MTNQLTLLFLVVVISGALCTVEDYVIMSQCAHNKAIYLAAEGTVSVTDISQTQNITIVGRPDFVNNNFKIALYAKETQRYLCFNDHWKLVGMKELQDTCYFNEAIVHGYFVFRSVVESQRRIGFTQRGRAVGPKKTVNDACYMFTKIPTDQFFHQHNHYASLSAPKTTKTPKTEHGAAHFGRGSGAGSGGGRPKPNRHRNQHRNEDGEPSGKSHGKKNKFHGGNRKRQHQQRMQQMRGGGGSGSGSGSGNGVAISSDPKNSSYLNSSRQYVELSQYGAHNHTGKHHNHSQPQAHHQTRHHHTSDARRHHHDAKQKAHHRARVTSSSPEATLTKTTTTATPRASEKTAVTSTKSKLASNTVEHDDIKPTSVVQPVTTVAASGTTISSRDVLSSTVAHKRKGRRRKSHRKHPPHKNEQHQDSVHLSDSSHIRHGHAHATLAAYDDEDDVTTDLTTWINSEKTAHELRSAVKPTSASLPSWETWYPSPSSASQDDIPDYSSSSVASYEKDTEASKWVGILSVSALASPSAASPTSPSLDDKNPLPLLPLPLPTSDFSASYTENKVEEVISPTTIRTTITTATTTRKTTQKTTTTKTTAATTTTTTNTSNLQENGKWLERQNHEEDFLNLSKQEAANVVEEANNITFADNENATLASTPYSDFFEVSESLTESYMDAADATHQPSADEHDDKLFSRPWAPTKSTEPHESSEKSHDTSAETGGKMMTDYLYATRSAPLAGNHKSSRHRHNEHGMASQKHQHNSNNGQGSDQKSHHSKKPGATSSREGAILTTASTTTTTSGSDHISESSPSLKQDDTLSLDSLLTAEKNFNARQSHNTVTDPESLDAANTLPPQFSSTATAAVAVNPSAAAPLAPSTTRKTLRKSTQRLLATPFHQLTYVRNEAGDIDIDSLDNISIYPDLLDNDQVNDEETHKSGAPAGTSRFTMISGYLPTSATATLPESIRIAKIKINRERKRMLRLRNIGDYSA